MRCLTSGSICPSLIRLLYLSTTSFFVGLTHEVPCDFETMASLSVFSGCCNLCLRPSCQQSDRHADVSNPPQKTWSPVFMCARQPGLTAKSWDMSFFFYTCHTHTDSSRLSLRSLHNPPGGKAFRVFAVIWVHQRASSSNRTSNTRAGQSSPGCQTQWVKCFWLC